MKIKRIIATMLAGVITCSATAITAGAYSTGINLHQGQGAPGTSVVMRQSWAFTAASTTTSMTLTTFTSPNPAAYVYLYSNTGISSIKRGIGGVSAGGVKKGTSVYASASFNDYDYHSYYAYGTLNG